MRLGKIKELEKEEQIKTGFLTCKTCLEKKELYYFIRVVIDDNVYYQDRKCKKCSNGGKEININKRLLDSKIKDHKQIKIKSNVRLSLETRNFVKRLIMMKGYIDGVEAFKLVHYHIQTFGYVERLFVNTELELSIMFKELLEVYKRDNEQNNI